MIRSLIQDGFFRLRSGLGDFSRFELQFRTCCHGEGTVDDGPHKQITAHTNYSAQPHWRLCFDFAHGMRHKTSDAQRLDRLGDGVANT